MGPPSPVISGVMELWGPYEWPKINGFAWGYMPYKWSYKLQPYLELVGGPPCLGNMFVFFSSVTALGNLGSKEVDFLRRCGRFLLRRG